MKRAKLIGLVLIVVLLLTLVWQNAGQVEAKILFWSVSMPGALLYFLTGAAGFLAGVLTCLLLMRKPRPGSVKASAKPEPKPIESGKN